VVGKTIFSRKNIFSYEIFWKIFRLEGGKGQNGGPVWIVRNTVTRHGKKKIFFSYYENFPYIWSLWFFSLLKVTQYGTFNMRRLVFCICETYEKKQASHIICVVGKTIFSRKIIFFIWNFGILGFWDFEGGKEGETYQTLHMPA
jgi:hypothetical protein